jgi:hypothetical protein
MKKINEEFRCENCGKIVGPAARTCRNHCPRCFCSLHVDGAVPGDRAATCRGKMRPREIEQRDDARRILFECEKCGKKHWNKRAEDDDLDALLGAIENSRGKF